MFDKFQDFMYYLLISPLKKVKKEVNQWYILFKVLGKRLDDAKESIYRAREESCVVSCSEELLEEQAAERGIKRYNGESSEGFRRRIINYREVMKLAGTDDGVVLAVKTLGHEKVKVIKAKIFKKDESRWAEFYLVVDVDLEKHPPSFEHLKKEVRRVKQVGSKDNYYFYFRTKTRNQNNIKVKSRFRWKITFYNYRKLDGSFLLNGENRLNATRVDYKVKYKKGGMIEEL